jgi:hypothetical protein
MFAQIMLTLAILGVAVALIAVRTIFLKGGEFRGTCATNNPLLTDKLGKCAVCKKAPEDRCDYDAEPGKAG